MPALHPKTAEAAAVVPSPRQLAWQKLGFYGIAHFGMNTFTDSEWGDGTESPSLFHPEKLDCRQWAKVYRSAGMRGMILTAKHHDGFCLWPTKTTPHSVASSPWKDGLGDVVREAAGACAEFGLAFGVYLSTWDRNAASYGSDAYNDFFKAQLRELCTNYGELFCVWLDGACGEGKGGKKQDYDWQGYYNIIRELQPNAVIANRGPDVRWVGNEAGVCRSSEFSVVPKGTAGSTYWDLGSRAALKKAKDKPLVWYPAEVNVSIRSGWFYHQKDDYGVKPLSKLRDIYYKSVGANAAFLLGVPPTPEGLIHAKDIDTLLSLGAQLRIDFKENLAEDSTMKANCRLDKAHHEQQALEPGETHWHSGKIDKTKPELVLDLGDDYDIDKVVLRENIATGQQIEKFSLWYDENTTAEGKSIWKLLEKNTVIGSGRICRFPERRLRRLKLVIEQARGFATIQNFEAY